MSISAYLNSTRSWTYFTPPQKCGLGIKLSHPGPSLQDYVVDKLRSEQYYLDKEVSHMCLAQQGAHQIPYP